MVSKIIRWIVIAFLIIDLGYLHLRVSLMETQMEIVWCLIYPKPPFCTLMGDRHERQTPTPSHPKKDKITI